ncbi:MAG: methyltransferase domain-containing protein [Pseudomonadales bacterium]|nr:methyltransferase domain-containing protein [Pseudomonadales bacterium]MDP6825499.1 methyltransferase domain-containing protein [Pseudomonadales bacterium]MDP6970492.1 methyltransferase domain-containing protein [Pseudomonadales bacterium]
MERHEIEAKLEAARSLAWFHRFEVIKGSGIYTPGSAARDYDHVFKYLDVDTSSFENMRVLDVGAATGGLSFFLEDCGANVVALDPDDPNQNGFNVVHEIRNSSVTHTRTSVYDICPDQLGTFDIVFFFGVFYHLQHPLLALQRINSVCKPGALLIGGGTSSDRWFFNDDDDWTQGADFESINSKRILNRAVLNVKNLNELALAGFSAKPYLHDKTIWYLPNRSCLKEWLEASGFAVDGIATGSVPLYEFYDDRGDARRKRRLLDWIPSRLRNNKIWPLERYRGNLNFKARYESEPTPEWPGPRMQQYQVPTRYELEQLRRENELLKSKLEAPVA